MEKTTPKTAVMLADVAHTMIAHSNDAICDPTASYWFDRGVHLISTTLNLYRITGDEEDAYFERLFAKR